MDCRKAQELLDARFDEDDASKVSAGGMYNAALDAHIAQCDACRTLESRLSRLESTLSAARAANDELFAAASTNRSVLLERQSRRAHLPRRLMWSAAGLAAAACLVWVLYFSSALPSGTRQAAEQVESPPAGALERPRAPARTGVQPRAAMVRLTGESHDRLIAIEKDTGVPRVRLVQVYALAPRKAAAPDETEPQT
jgi:hypothetical protein